MIMHSLAAMFGMALLLGGAELLVRGSSAVARYFKVSGLVIGLTIVSFGTSLPELVVNILASLRDSADLALGNILGSNIANILLVLAVTALITPIAVRSRTVKREIPVAIFGAGALIVLGNGIIGTPNVISQIEGLVLLTGFGFFMWYVYRLMRSEQLVQKKHDIRFHGKREGSRPRLAWLLMLVGIIGLAIGGDILVTNASSLAEIAGLSEAFIGIVIIGIGTSMPELATSAVAAFKKQVDMAVGNIIGSNIFNIFWVIGLSAVINPLEFNPGLTLDAFVGMGALLLLAGFLINSKKRFMLNRPEALIMLVCFGVYLAYIFTRG